MNSDSEDDEVMTSQQNEENLSAGLTLDEEIRLIEKEFIQRTLTITKHDICKAAKSLGVGEDFLKKKIEKLGLKL